MEKASSMKKCLEDRKMTRKRNEDEPEERIDDGCKWVKTDSEYIVLETSSLLLVETYFFGSVGWMIISGFGRPPLGMSSLLLAGAMCVVFNRS